jgi:hypothetical protein
VAVLGGLLLAVPDWARLSIRASVLPVVGHTVLIPTLAARAPPERLCEGIRDACVIGPAANNDPLSRQDLPVADVGWRMWHDRFGSINGRYQLEMRRPLFPRKMG